MALERVVRVIPGREELRLGLNLPKRACAYVRVSTGHDAQLNSLQNQTEYYERKIKANPGFVFCGIYSDAGISGSREDRPGFQAMLDAARRGMMDVILTKSISRFARNTELLLHSVRELRRLGVGVIFEENRLNTLSAEGELLLTILASVAEEERRSVSKNIQWSIRAGYKKGKPSTAIHRLYGYRKGTNGRIEIDPMQARIVTQIYQAYLAGDSAEQIARALNSEDAPRDVDMPWSGHSILRILANERYAGDCLLQKTFITDTGKQVRNKGQLDRYFVQGHHPAIVSRGDWEAVQMIREERKPNRYPFSSMLRCGLCGASLIRVTAEKKHITWVCATYLHHGKAACAGTRVPERVVEAYHALNPITEPVVIEEAEDARKARTKTTEHYRFSPVAQVRAR